MTNHWKDLFNEFPKSMANPYALIEENAMVGKRRLVRLGKSMVSGRLRVTILVEHGPEHLHLFDSRNPNQ